MNRIAKLLAVVAFLAGTPLPGIPADQTAASDAQRKAMKKLEWLVGRWKGAGWIQMGPQGRHEFTQTEAVEAKLEGLVLIIDGLGKDKQDGSTVHTALAVVSYDHRAEKFRWRAFTQHGEMDSDAKVGQDTVEWGLDIPQRGRMRYTIKRTADDTWLEVGEMSQDNETWHKFFEMTLQRQK